ncbi:transcription factor TFIIF complex subunit Tfg3 [Coemansia asiatica]|nr:transcription factor TFIIF complex subunit Tfg3 [Coemansia asiatica]
MIRSVSVVVSRAPFSVQEEGWGEFDLDIVVHFHHSGETMHIVHDLNFHEGESYSKEYQFTIPNPSPAFLSLFSKRSPVSRKTIPSRGSKARKGPPRDSVYSNKAHCSPHSSESIDALSADDRGFSESDSDSNSNNDRNSDRSASASESESDLGSRSSSRSGASKDRSASSASAAARRAKDASARGSNSNSFRPSISTKHVPQAATHAEDPRHQRTPSAAIRASTKSERDSLSSVRRVSNAVPAALGGMTKHRRSPTDSPPKQRTNAVSADRGPASALRDRSLEKSLSPVNPALAPTASTTLSGVKRRLSDALDSPSSKASIRRRTLAQSDARISSVSPPRESADTRADAALPISRRPTASGIAKVKVPKKRDRLLADDRDRDLDPLPAGKQGRGAIGSSRKQTSRPLEIDEHMSPQPSVPQQQQQQQQQSAALTSREIFIRERERQRYLEQARDAAAAGSAGIRANATKPASSLSSSTSSTSSSSITAAANGVSRSMRATASSNKAAAQGLSDDESIDRTADVARRKTIRRDLPTSAASTKQSLTNKHSDLVAEVASADNLLPKKSISRERKPSTATSTATSLMRVKRTLSAENKKTAKADHQQASKAVSSIAQTKGRNGNADLTDKPENEPLPPAQLIRRMERIMERANMLNEQALVDFLHLLHTLRVEQEPDMADRITEEAVDLVENNGEYSCNLSSLRPEAIDRLWAFVR